MSRVGIFRSHNKVGETWSFKSLTWSGVTFGATIAFEGGISNLPHNVGEKGGNPNKRVSWDYGVVTGATNATTSQTNPTGGYYGNLRDDIKVGFPTTFPDFDNPKTITIRTNRLNDIKFINMRNWTYYPLPCGNLDLSEFSGLESLEIYGPGTSFLSGVTFPSSYRTDRSLNNLYITQYQTDIEDNWHQGGTGLKGELDLTGVILGGGLGYTDSSKGWLNLSYNGFLNSVKHGPSDEKFYYYNISPNLDPYAYTQWTASETYRWKNPVSHGDGYSGLTGTHDMSMLTGLGGLFNLSGNKYLNKVILPTSGNRFTAFLMAYCNLKGHLDLSGIDIGNGVVDDYTGTSQYPNQAGYFDVRYQGVHGWPTQYSYALTGITHAPSTSNINTYWCQNNGFRSLDLSMLKLGTPEDKLYSGPPYTGAFSASGCKYLTGITHSYTDLYLRAYDIGSCVELLNHDMTMIPNLCGFLTAASCHKLKTLSHTACTSTYPLTSYNISNSGIEGHHDMSMFPKLGGHFLAFSCHSLTGVTFTTTSETFSRFEMYQCSLTDTLDVRNLQSLGGEFEVDSNKGDYFHTVPTWPNRRPTGLRKILHTGSTVNFTKYYAHTCALEGELDVSMLENLGGTFNTSLNYSGFTNYYGNLTNIKFPSNDRPITISAYKCNLQDNLDVSMMSGMTYLNVSHNASLSGITIQENHPYPLTINAHYKSGHETATIPLKSWGNWDLSHVTGLTSLDVRYNVQLSGLTLPLTTNPMTLVAEGADIQPDLDLTPCGGLKYLTAYHNVNLTGVTFTSSVEDIERLQLHDCDLTGTIDISMLTTLGVGDPNDVPNITKDGAWVSFHNNPNLTEIIHPPHTNMIRNFNISNCGFSGHMDLSTYSMGVGYTWTAYEYQGEIWISNLPNMTTLTLPQVPTYIRKFICTDNGVKDLDFTTMDIGAPQPTDLSGDRGWENASVYYGYQVYNNPSLTGVTHGTYSRQINNYQFNNNDLTGTLDVSTLTNLRWKIRLDHNPNLTNILFPISTEVFFDVDTQYYNHAFQLNDCNFGYVDFSPLAGATLNNEATTSTIYATIHLEDNGMSATDVNHILVDFATIATNNSPRWDNVTLIINGSNAAPDGTSGSFDGIGARNTLLNTYNWNITIT